MHRFLEVLFLLDGLWEDFRIDLKIESRALRKYLCFESLDVKALYHTSESSDLRLTLGLERTPYVEVYFVRINLPSGESMIFSEVA